ncbi:MAG: hypothetical protein LC109_10335 [Bacteroidia bacterium]|nr:hypothetical protein [Bacteroidia bacterium]MCO5253580.1 hypothetical protein [Bacteroidota bacterium]MCZ2130650.1 hypothetical protein [Bacteroidia bacterium]
MFANNKAQFLVLCVIIASFFVLTQCTGSIKSHDKSNAANFESPYLNTHDSVKYVGSQVCRQCHEDKFEQFSHTEMGMSFGKATKQKSASFGHGDGHVYDTLKDLHYTSFWEGDIFFIKEFRLLNDDTVYQRKEKIDYIIGSGHHTNSHMIIRNGFLFQAPMTFYTQSGMWDLPPGFRGNNPRFERRIESECMTCHNAYPTPDQLSDNRYFEIPEGINCERCHGPGELHVARRLTSRFVQDPYQFDSSIVNPRKLPYKLQTDVCQRCHLQGDNVLKPGKTFYDFRPGMPLSSIFTVFMPEYSEDEEFRMGAHSERLQMSQCFIQSNKGNEENFNSNMSFTCITCHDPHVSVRSMTDAHFNQTCQSCHTTPKTVCSEDKNKIKLQNNNCVSCHMPRSGAVDIPHVTVHDHFIRKNYDRKSTHGQGKLLGLRSVNIKQADVTSTFAGYVSYYEKFEHNPFYLQKAKTLYNQLGNSQYAIILKIYFHYTANEFVQIPALAGKINRDSVSDAWTFYRIAKSFENINNKLLALEWMKEAVKIKPHFSPFMDALISLEIDLKHYGKAQSDLTALFKLDARDDIAMGLQSKLYYLTGDIKNANQTALRTLKLNPDNAIALEILIRIADASGNRPSLYEYWKQRLEAGGFMTNEANDKRG